MKSWTERVKDTWPYWLGALLLSGIACTLTRHSALPLGSSQRQQTAKTSSEQAGTDPAAERQFDLTLVRSESGLWEWQRGGVTLMSSKRIFWKPDWKWVGIKQRDAADEQVGFSVSDLGIDGLETSETSDRQVVQRIEVNVEGEVKLTAGGYEFRVDERAGARSTKLLPDDGGFVIELADRSLEVRVKNAVSVSYERGDQFRIRVLLAEDELEAGKHNYTIVYQLPEGAGVGRSVAARLPEPSSSWLSGTLALGDAPVDLSFLNHKPAGSKGPVRAQGERLVFADGTPARFWGTNISAQGLFNASKGSVQITAKRLAALGYNLVRLHHHDSGWVQPNVFGKGKNHDGQPDEASLETIDALVAALEAEGIYVWIDLHVGRHFRKDDEIRGFEELDRDDDPQGKGFNFVNPDIEREMGRFARAYLTRKNRFTGRTWQDDPGVLAVLLTNENNVTHHFGNLFIQKEGGGFKHPKHHELFDRHLKTFAARTEHSEKALFKTWEPGAAKLLLNDIEHGFYARAKKDLRNLGYDGPVAHNNLFKSRLYSLPAMATGDVVDVHSYGELGALLVDPSLAANYVHHIGFAQVTGKPLTVSEYSVEYPIADRFTSPLYVAGIASLQGWDALMAYAYAHRNLAKGHNKVFKWEQLQDPAFMAQTPAAALIYRRGYVQGARRTYRLEPDSDFVYESPGTPHEMPALRTLIEQSRVTVTLPEVDELKWDQFPKSPKECSTESEACTVVKDMKRSFLPEGAHEIRSDTGELRRDFTQGLFTVDAEKAKGATGFFHDQPVKLEGAVFKIENPAAAVSLVSLDDTAVNESKKLLLTTVAQAVARGDRLPFVAEPVEGDVSFATKHPRLCALALGPDGSVQSKRVVQAQEGTVRFELPATTHWYEFTLDAARCQ